MAGLPLLQLKVIDRRYVARGGIIRHALMLNKVKHPLGIIEDATFYSRQAFEKALERWKLGKYIFVLP